MTKSKTASFVLELPLVVDSRQEAVLLARLEAGRQVYNACLGQALKRREHLLYSRAYQTAQAMQPGPARTKAFGAALKAVGFHEYAVHEYAVQFGHSWLGEHLDSLTVQKLASRAFDAVQKYHFGQRGRPRFKSYNQLDSVEGKTNRSGLRWYVESETVGYVWWLGLRLEPMLDAADEVVQHGLAAPVKYVGLVRRKVAGHNRFYVQLVCKGVPFHKGDHLLGEGTVGLDLGPSSIAVVGQDKALLAQFCAELEPRQVEIRRLQRKLDRQRRANNPDNFNADGTIKKGNKTWRKSGRQQQTAHKLAEVQRKAAAYRRSLHGQLVNRVLAMGNDIRLEKVSYRAFQRQFGRSVGFRGPGMFVTLLKQKAASAAATVTEFSTHNTRLSQTCHQCGKVEKKPLSERWHRCECGVVAQRDLYSAFLAQYVEHHRLNADQAKLAWSGQDTVLQAALSDAPAQLANGRAWPASFGLGRKQSQSPGKAGRQAAKAFGGAGQVSSAQREAAHRPELPGFSRGD